MGFFRLPPTMTQRIAEHSKNRNRQLADIRQSLGKNSLVLIGLMGAGKTVLGRRLAGALDLTFIDADGEIEAAAGQTVKEIFAEHGEAYFRTGERKVIARLLENGPQVLATGGGAYMDPETRAVIERHGTSIWLKANLRLLMKRVGRRDSRPLLQVDNPEAVMRKLMATRNPVYAEADITVESRDVPHEVIVGNILDSLSARYGNRTAPRNRVRRKKTQ